MSTSGDAPSARCGHAAFYETITISDIERKRMIVFGGSAAPGQASTDMNVYELRFDPAQPNVATWSVLPRVDLSPGVTDEPGPRHWHTLTHDAANRIGPGNRAGKATFLLGGRLDATSYSDTLWILWTFADGTVGWERKPFGEASSGARPSARARHSVVIDREQGGQAAGRLYVYGGENAAGPVDASTHVLDPWASTPPANQWKLWQQQTFALSGHTTVLDREVTNARIPEVYSANGDSPQAYTGHPHHWHHTYPLNFAVGGSSTPGGRLLTVGQDALAHWLDIPAAGQQPSQGWQTISPALDAGFLPETGVMYRPGRILIAGGRHAGNFAVVGTSRTLDAANLAAGWQNSALASPLATRRYHNLVLLPDGRVLAVGGNSTNLQSGDPNPVMRPQIWDPDGEGGIGSWTPPTQLAAQSWKRGYHSTALLLPDGRVLSSSGEDSPDRYRTEMYCPPYLYKNDGVTLAQRPVITSAPSTLTWGGTFTVCASAPSQVTRVALVRPGATTHAFDENQRYVPLDFTPATDPDRLLVSAPANADDAPPGYYMLFLTGVVDGGQPLPDVPSIARWVRIGPDGTDLCDAVVPAKPGGFGATSVCGDPTVMDLAWTAPADDGVLAASGAAKSYEVRHSTVDPGSDVPTWFEGTATPVSPGPPPPAVVPTAQSLRVTGLTPSTWYWFAIRAVDDNNGRSTIATKKIRTNWLDCEGFAGGGGGGGGSSMRGDSGPLSRLPGGPMPGGVEGVPLFESATAGGAARDAMPLADPGEGRLTAWLRAGAAHAACIDRARLALVEHDPGLRVFHTGERPVVGRLSPAIALVDAQGARLAGWDEHEEGGLMAGGAWVEADLGASESTSRLLHVVAQRVAPLGEPASTGMVVQLEEGGLWRDVHRLHPRRAFGELLAPIGNASRVRLRFDSDALVRAVGVVEEAPEAPSIVHVPPNSSARDGVEADAASLRTSDGTSHCVEGPGELSLGFELPPVPSGRARTLFLEWDAASTSRAGAAAARSLPSPAPAAGFALHASRPNPMRHVTSIEYELAAPAEVVLELHDAQGRSVARFELGRRPPGRHSHLWDARDDRGRAVSPGVYSVRIGTGAASAQRRIVVLP